MIRTLLHDPATGTQRTGGEELIDAWAASGRALIWVDLHDEPAESERELMQTRFGLHRLAVQDAQRDRHPPKLELFEDHLFLLLRGLDAETTDIQFGTIQIAAFVGERALVTRHSGVSLSIERLWERAQGEPALLAAGPGAPAVALTRQVVDRYFPILMGVEQRLEQLEADMVERPSDALLAELVAYQANLKKLRRVMAYHVQVFDKLRKSAPRALRESLEHELNDVYEHIERAMSLATLHYELAGDLMNGYLSLASHRLNQIMKVLTIVTAIFVPLGFLAGLYGMNFEYIPELQFRYGYFVLLGVMTLIAVALLVVFRLRRWL